MADNLDLGIALGGGGAKGLSHIPFLAALDDLGVRPAMISGCSIGAIVGGLYAAGLSARDLAEILESDGFVSSAKQGMSLFSWAADGLGLLGGFLNDTLPVKDFDGLKHPAMFVASDFWTREQVVMQEGDLVSAICASSALPGLMKPVERAGRVLIDGGCVNPLPFDLLTGKVARIAAISVAGAKNAEDAALKPNRTNALFNAFQIMQNSILREKLKANRVDFLAEPGLTNIRVLEFNRADWIMESVSEDVDRFKYWIEAVVLQA